MRGLKVRSADTLAAWSEALAAHMGVNGLRAYIDAQDMLAMPKTGGTFTGPVILEGDALTAQGAVTLQQMQAAIVTAIDDLKGGAPAALDTLYEIANALNNDAGAVNNLLTAIGNKADLAGATFTGPVIVPSNTTDNNAVVTLGDVTALIAGIPSAPTLIFDAGVFTDSISGKNRNVGLAQSGVTAGTYAKVTTDVYGRVTDGASLTAGDLPSVTLTYGDVFNTGTVPLGTTLSIETALNTLQTYVLATDYVNTNTETTVSYSSATRQHSVTLVDRGITAGTYTKVTLNSKGVVTDAVQLLASDLPSITPTVSATLNGVYTITEAIEALDAKHGAEDTWIGDGETIVFASPNINWAEAVAKPRRLFVFIDGLRQPASSYSLGLGGLRFNTAPVTDAEIEAVFIS